MAAIPHALLSEVTGGSAISPTLFGAKGEILIGLANDTPGILSPGANGLAVVYDSTLPGGLKAAAPNPAAHAHLIAEISGLQAELDTLESDIAALEGGSSSEGGLASTYNAKANGIFGLGLADESSAIEAFYNAVPAGSTVYFPKGIYIGLHDPDKSIVILGDGDNQTEFRCPTAPAANTKLVDFGSSTKCGLIGVKLNAMSEVNCVRGVNNEGSGTDKHLVVANSWFQDFRSTTGLTPHGGGCGIYVWTADAVSIYNNNFVDCVYDILMDAPGPDCRVVNNKAWSPAALTREGIVFRRSTGAYSGSLCALNTVENVRVDPGGIGQDGHAIDLIRCGGMRVLCNSTRDTATAGVHIGAGAYGAKVIGNDLSEAGILNGGAVYCEMNISTTDATGLNLLSARRNGAIVMFNSIYNNNSYGMSMSYAAGSLITHNWVGENNREGIFCDSDYVLIQGNMVWNNHRTDAAATPTSTPNVQAQIRVTTGDHCVVVDNIVWDNLAVPTSDYGIAVTNANHIVGRNMCMGVIAPIYEASGGPTNSTRDNPGYVTVNAGVATVANGGTIPHGLSKTPNRVTLNSRVLGHIVGDSLVDATNITVLLSDAAGAAVGVAEGVRWTAEHAI